MTQAKQAHWNVRGPHFMSLHELFDKIAGHGMEYTDTLAERIVQLGGSAEGTLKVVAQRTEMPVYPLGIFSDHDHVEALSKTLAMYGESIRRAVGHVNELSDIATADILTEISCKVDKYLWFVEAHRQVEHYEVESSRSTKVS